MKQFFDCAPTCLNVSAAVESLLVVVAPRLRDESVGGPADDRIAGSNAAGSTFWRFIDVIATPQRVALPIATLAMMSWWSDTRPASSAMMSLTAVVLSDTMTSSKFLPHVGC